MRQNFDQILNLVLQGLGSATRTSTATITMGIHMRATQTITNTSATCATGATGATCATCATCAYMKLMLLYHTIVLAST